MKYRTLGTTGIKASVISLGTHQFSGEWGVEYSAREVADIVHRAGELGINLIDTAECYGDHMVEEMIANAVRGSRDDWTIATKFGHRSHSSAKKTDAWTAAEVREQLEASLRAFKTDHVDLYQFHSGSNQMFDNDELWRMLSEQVALGKIRFLGISHSGELTAKGDLYQLKEAERRGAKVAQVVYNRLSNEAEKGVLPFCKAHNIGVLARIPLSRGFLGGRYAPGTVFAKGDIRASAAPGFNEARLKQAEEIKRMEVPEGMNMAQWALAWCLAHPAVSSVIVGSKSVKQLETNAAAADIEVERPIF